MNNARLAQNAKTIVATVMIAALFAAVATQIYALVVPTANALPLLALFFVVGVCVAWIMVRLEARWQRAEHSQGDALAGERGKAAAVDRTEAPAATEVSDAPAAEAERETGTVKWFDRKRAYGFIVRSDGEEIFVHQHSVRRQGQSRPALNEGQTVSFVAVERKRGWQADDVVGE